MSRRDERQVLVERIADERASARARLISLRRAFSNIVDATETANVDDEHDPEGSTIAFDRAQVVSLIDAEQRRLEALDLAAAKIALPTATRCVACAERTERGRGRT